MLLRLLPSSGMCVRQSRGAMPMPITNRSVRVHIKEGHTNMDAFVKDILRVVKRHPPYGMYVVLFDEDNCAHGYQFGLTEGDFDIVGMIANEHRKL